MSERALANDLEAEQSVIGALLMDRDAIARVQAIVTPQDFASHATRTVYEAITALFERRVPADLTTVSTELKSRNQLDAVGGTAYLASLLLVVPTSAHVEHYAEIVHRYGIKRRLTNAVTQAYQRVFDEDVSTIETAIADVQRIFSGIEVGIDHEDMRAYDEAVPEFLQGLRDELSGTVQRDVVPFGDRAIDDALNGGLSEGEVAWIGARPSIGKTSFGLQWAHNFVRKEAPHEDKRYAVFFSAEMSLRALLYRAVAEVTGIDGSDLRKLNLTDRQLHNLAGHERFMKKMPLVVSDKSQITTDQMLQRVDRWSKTRGRVRLVVIDYSELLGDGLAMPNLTEERRLTKISRGIKHLAKESGASVIALTQLNRKVEERPGCRPHMSDIRWAGSIEQDAEVIGFLWRQDYYVEKKMIAEDKIDPAKVGTADFLMEKNRNGRTGDFPLRFNPSLTAFTSLEDPPR